MPEKPRRRLGRIREDAGIREDADIRRHWGALRRRAFSRPALAVAETPTLLPGDARRPCTRDDPRSPVLHRRGACRDPPGARERRLRRHRHALAAHDGPRCVAGACRRHPPAHPRGPGRRVRMGLPGSMGPAQPRHPDPGRCGRRGARLSPRRLGVRRGAVACGRGHVGRLRRAPARPRARAGAADACTGRRRPRVFLGRRHGVHHHDRPRGRAAVPDLRHAPAPAARHLRRHGRGVLRHHELDQGPRLRGAGPARVRQPDDRGGLVPGRHRLDLRGRRPRAARLARALLHGRLRPPDPRRAEAPVGRCPRPVRIASRPAHGPAVDAPVPTAAGDHPANSLRSLSFTWPAM